MWYASSCSGTTISTGVSSGCDLGTAIRKSCAGSSRSLDALVPLGREGDDRAAARLRFLDVADHLLEHVVVRRDRDDRHLLVDERDRAVLHLAGRIALGVDVRDLLQLQRALERDRIVDARARDRGSRCAGRTAWRSPRSCGSHLSVCSSSSGSCVSASRCGLRRLRRQRRRESGRGTSPAGAARRAAT